jgi:F-type H+-transporting ATPase subunit gamma
MPSLKDLVMRRKAVQSTKKITLAMKMIAAAKLRKAQDQAIAVRPYADSMEGIIKALADRSLSLEHPPHLLIGTGQNKRHRLIVITANRGLCGNFNAAVVRQALVVIKKIQKHGESITLQCIGQKGRDILRATPYGAMIKDYSPNSNTPTLRYAQTFTRQAQEAFEHGEFDTCSIVYTRFISAMRQDVTVHRLIPYTPLADAIMPTNLAMSLADNLSLYEFEPNEAEVLNQLLPQNLVVQIYHALLESAASEHGARMTAMDGASRNAEEMLRTLQMRYNRMRQHFITTELIEIISGAEAM